MSAKDHYNTDLFEKMASFDEPINWGTRKPTPTSLQEYFKSWFVEHKCKLVPIPDNGNHMTTVDFLAGCESGTFVDNDGFGYWATEDKMTHIVVYPSEVLGGTMVTNYTHVVWFTK